MARSPVSASSPGLPHLPRASSSPQLGASVPDRAAEPASGHARSQVPLSCPRTPAGPTPSQQASSANLVCTASLSLPAGRRPRRLGPHVPTQSPMSAKDAPGPPSYPRTIRVLSPGLLTWASQFSEFANLMISFFFFFLRKICFIYP